MMATKTLPEVFIIESLDPDDEGNGRFEGAILSRILRLHGKVPKYRYVRTSLELGEAIKQFGRSKYRYLHISCHADVKGICTTNYEDISIRKLASLLSPHLNNHRLFMSACEVVHKKFAKELIPQSQCYSIIGPNESIAFTDASILWASLYHLMFTQNNSAMSRKKLRKVLQDTTNLFHVELSYFARSKSDSRGFTEDLLRK